MTTYADLQIQSTRAVTTYTADFTNDLPAGGTVTGGTAIHVPPSGSASNITTVVSSPYIYATLPVQSVFGVHFVDVVATMSNGEQAVIRIPISVVFPSPAAREGMADIISDLRGMTDAGPDDYELSGVPYWTDAQLQRILDNHRTEIRGLEIIPEQEFDGSYKFYPVGYSNIEQTTGGTAIFYVQDVDGNNLSSALYSVDYQRGVVTFVDDTLGTPYWVTGRAYDLDGAAGEIWRRKQSHYAAAVDFSTKVHNISRSQLFAHAKEMAEHYSSLCSHGFGSMDVMRSDTDE
jgi:hypothetical protein